MAAWPAIRPDMSSTAAIAGASNDAAMPARHVRALRLWLGALAALIVAMILVGGATQAHRFGPVHHRVAADPRRHPAVERGRLAGGFRRLSENPRIYRAQARHEPRRVQDHLLVGMGASFSRPADRRRLLRAVRRVLDRRLYSARAAAAAHRPVPARRASGRGRLVHGEERSGRAHRCEPVPARRAFRHRARHSRLHALAPVRPRRAGGRAHRARAARPGSRASCWR